MILGSSILTISCTFRETVTESNWLLDGSEMIKDSLGNLCACWLGQDAFFSANSVYLCIPEISSILFHFFASLIGRTRGCWVWSFCGTTKAGATAVAVLAVLALQLYSPPNSSTAEATPRKSTRICDPCESWTVRNLLGSSHPVIF